MEDRPDNRPLAAQPTDRLSFLWLELTGKCPLECFHCYAESSPRGTHGLMTDSDWLRVIDSASHLSVRGVQFIGGEPTLHPALPQLIRHALGRGLLVSVYTNLTRIPTALWAVFSLPGVRLATSYYSDVPEEHDAITRRPGSHARTTENIGEALHRRIPIQVGVVRIFSGQRVQQACEALAAMGVTTLATDELRRVGRGVRAISPDERELCGHCSGGVLAVLPDGAVSPCVFARWITFGNVRDNSLDQVVSNPEIPRVRSRIKMMTHPRRNTSTPGGDPCAPS